MEITSRDGIVALLGSSIGPEAARSAVDREADAMGFGNALTTLEGLDLLKRLEQAGGPSGLAARITLQRLERNASTQGSGQFRPSSIPEAPVRIAEIERILAVGVGEKKARELLHQALAFLGFAGEEGLTKENAVRALDVIEETQPSAASVARFAKVKIHLRR